MYIPLLRSLEPRRDDAAKLILRVTLAGLTLFHGVDKAVHGLGGVGREIASAGLPHVLAYGVYLGELVAPILILIGMWTRPAAVVLAGSILFATVIAHGSDYGAIGPLGGYAAESYVFYILSGAVVALMGAGRYAIGSGRWD